MSNEPWPNSELFQVAVPTVNEHLKGIYAEGELAARATIRKFRIVRTEGNREMAREIEHYNFAASTDYDDAATIH